MHPIQVSQWNKQLLEVASDMFTNGKKTPAKKAELFQQYIFAVA